MDEIAVCQQGPKTGGDADEIQMHRAGARPTDLTE